MKEFLLAGAVVAVLALSGAQTAGSKADEKVLSEGFVPHQRITAAPVQEADGGFLPDFGSQSYL